MIKNSPSLMKRLIHTYAIVLMVVILLFAILVGFVAYDKEQDRVLSQSDAISQKVSGQIDQFGNDLKRMMHDVFPNQAAIQSMLDYFSLDFDVYYEQQLSKIPFRIFQKDVQRIYDRYDNISGVLVSLDSSQDIFYSTTAMKMGLKYTKLPDVSNKLVFNRPIKSFDAYNNVGNMYLFADYAVVDRVIAHEHMKLKPFAMMVSSTGTVQYQHNTDKAKPFLEAIAANNNVEGSLDLRGFHGYTYQVRTLSNGAQFIVGAKNTDIFLSFAKSHLWFIVGSGALFGVLLLVLFKTFGRYDQQVQDILDSMEKVREGEVSYRVATDTKSDELLTISEALNTTLDSISAYTNQIYRLELSQQEINLRALQSQINPHFLYNTLEFIRMYAVSEGVEELADIVFVFSQLLRNNISLEKTATLAKELKFLEQYVYLYQVRYPNRVAYRFDVADNFSTISIPKFSLQPIVENYFKHGIDFSRIDNAIHVRVFKRAGRIYIRVSDNGRGIGDDKLKTLQQALDTSTFDVKQSKSVGLMNVHERLKVFFKDQAYTMKIGHSKTGGFSLTISFIEEAHDVQGDIN